VNRVVWIDGARVALQPAALLGQGGEAEVYDLGDGRVVKWWKPADHPDFEGLPAAQDAARERIALGASKLRALPALPKAVIGPSGFALAAKKSAQVVGYVMPKVSGVPLHSYGEPKWRRDNVVEGRDVVAALLALHDAIAGLHQKGIVVGDCNDLNVLVDGASIHMIDVDSYQFGAFGCSMFSERFVDPRLCDRELVPTKPHDEASDWFAFAVMAFRTLLGVGPWGGVHQPANPLLRCSPTLRALRRLWVLAKDVVYPRAARPVAVLPDELVDVFRGIFERDLRGVFPRSDLERLRLRRCSTCNEEHARVRCPACTTVAHLPPAVVHGNLKWWPLTPASVKFASYEITGTTPVWLAGDALMRSTRIGPERIGSVLARQTRAWCGDKLGVGFYRAGGYAVGFVFRPDRGVLDDRVVLPKLRGQLVDAHATIGTDRAWLWLTTVEAGRLVTTCVVVGSDATVIATETLADAPWVAGVGGACAAGPHLFVPTDDGIARIEIVQGTITQTRTFAETAPLVASGDRLALDNSGGIDVVRRRDAIRLTLT
jgi:hypothetical protein